MLDRIPKSFALLLVLAGLPMISEANGLESAFSHCKGLQDNQLRLSCYDKLDIKQLLESSKPSFEGKRTVKTDVFELLTPTLMRYESDGAIFVLALHDEEGGVIQNLHIGGGGTDSYLIERPGRYFLRINGSTTWRIWLDNAE